MASVVAVAMLLVVWMTVRGTMLVAMRVAMPMCIAMAMRRWRGRGRGK